MIKKISYTTSSDSSEIKKKQQMKTGFHFKGRLKFLFVFCFVFVFFLFLTFNIFYNVYKKQIRKIT